MRVVCVEGAPGVGKSSSIAEIRTLRPDWLVIAEPADRWAPLLSLIDSGNQAANIALQGMVAGHYASVSEQLATSHHPVVVIERSPASMLLFAQLAADGNGAAMESMTAAARGCAPLVVTQYICLDDTPVAIAARVQAREHPGDDAWSDASSQERYAEAFDALWPHSEITTRIDVGGKTPVEVAAELVCSVAPAVAVDMFM